MGNNGSQAQSTALDFNKVMEDAKASGDYGVLIESAKESKKLFDSFREAVLTTAFLGKYSHAVSGGLKLLDNMVMQADGQINTFRQMERTAPPPQEESNG